MFIFGIIKKLNNLTTKILNSDLFFFGYNAN